jgi:hypothetical protein
MSFCLGLIGIRWYKKERMRGKNDIKQIVTESLSVIIETLFPASVLSPRSPILLCSCLAMRELTTSACLRSMTCIDWVEPLVCRWEPSSRPNMAPWTAPCPDDDPTKRCWLLLPYFPPSFIHSAALHSFLGDDNEREVGG